MFLNLIDKTIFNLFFADFQQMAPGNENGWIQEPIFGRAIQFFE